MIGQANTPELGPLRLFKLAFLPRDVYARLLIQ